MPLVLLSHSECLQTPFIFKLKACFGCAVLHEAEHLDEKLRVLDYAPVSTNCLIRDVRAAHFTLILDLDELDVCDKSENLDHVPDDLVCRNGLDQLDLIIRLEISHLVLYLTNDLEV